MLKLSTVTALIALIVTRSAIAVEGGAPTPELNPAQQLFFMDNHLRGVNEGSILDYRFSSITEGEEPFTDRVRMIVTAVENEKKRSIKFDFLSGARHIDFTPATGYVGNPVLIHFLEYDIKQMARETGGGSGYFRNVIRRSFETSLMRPVTITFEGNTLDATEIVVKPFISDSNIDKFRAYQEKQYEFIFSNRIPGGVYRMHSLVPGANGEGVFSEETLTFSGLGSET
ncbi:MAG: hypothetical protein GY703_22035 [Gammaproteobacteria bacterium]|nr:hypothetical protein [Gammaproteobacteria bacterium]